MAEQTPKTKGILAVQQRQMNEIRRQLEGRTEHQLLVLQYLASLNDAGPKKAELKKGSSRISVEESPPEIVISDTETLGRSGRKYANWSKAMVEQMLAYIDPEVFSMAGRKTDSHALLKQIAEYATGLVFDCHEQSDSSSTTNKLATFSGLRRLYINGGNRCKALEFKDGQIDWTSQGCYAVQWFATDGKPRVEVTCKGSGFTKELPQECVPEHCPRVDSSMIRSNYSIKRATLVLKDFQFTLLQLFPRLRKVQRHLSDELGCTERHVEPENQKGEQAQKGGRGASNAKAKGKARGKVKGKATGMGMGGRDKHQQKDQGKRVAPEEPTEPPSPTGDEEMKKKALKAKQAAEAEKKQEQKGEGGDKNKGEGDGGCEEKCEAKEAEEGNEEGEEEKPVERSEEEQCAE